MNREDVLKLLSKLLAIEVETEPTVNEEEYFVEVSIQEPLTDISSIYRYSVQSEQEITVEKLEGGNVVGKAKKTFREIVWKSCGLTLNIMSVKPNPLKNHSHQCYFFSSIPQI